MKMDLTERIQIITTHQQQEDKKYLFFSEKKKFLPVSLTKLYYLLKKII